MADVSLFLSPPSPEQGPLASLPTESGAIEHPEQLIAQLHTAITQRQLDLNASLQRIANAARSLTGASGIAIAMRQDGLVVCLSRSGETAPPIGARLHVDSGISGEALLLARTLSCEDSELDPRVDAHACRSLGIRSLVVVPLRTRQAVIGVLEAFYQVPRAFSERHVELLEKLAELSVIAQYCAISPRNHAASEYDFPGGSLQQDSVLAAASVIVQPESTPQMIAPRSPWSAHRALIISVLVMMTMLGALGWMLRDESNPEEASPAMPAASPTPVDTQPIAPARTQAADVNAVAAPPTALVWDASTMTAPTPAPRKRNSRVTAAAATTLAGERIEGPADTRTDDPTSTALPLKPSAGMKPPTKPADAKEKVNSQRSSVQELLPQPGPGR